MVMNAYVLMNTFKSFAYRKKYLDRTKENQRKGQIDTRNMGRRDTELKTETLYLTMSKD